MFHAKMQMFHEILKTGKYIQIAYYKEDKKTFRQNSTRERYFQKNATKIGTI